MRYTVEVTKTIVAHVDADTEEQALELAEDYDTNGWDGLWYHATPGITIIGVDSN